MSNKKTNRTKRFGKKAGHTRYKFYVTFIFFILLFSTTMVLTASANESNPIIYGHITDVDGKNISNVNVSVYQWETDYENSTLSDSNGFYNISVPAGEVLLEVQVKGHSPNPYSNWIYIEEDTEKNFTFYPQNAVIRGKITANSENGSLIDDAEVFVYWNSEDEEYDDVNSTSTSSGFYNVNVAAGEVYLEIYADGYADESTPIYTINPGDTVWINVSLLPENSVIYGFVTDGVTGEGIEDADVTVYWTDKQGEDRFNSTYTDTSGHYRINVAAVDVTLYVEAEGYFSQHVDVGVVAANESKEINVPLYVLSNPSPENGATNVKVDADLTWECAYTEDNITYDVYLDTMDPPQKKVSSNQSATTYNPGKLSYSTTYYWRITAWNNDADGNAVGPVWHFTTQKKTTSPPPPPPPPPAPTNVEPTADADGPYYGFVDTPIAFNGSESNDSDGTIVAYEWSFGDGSTGTGINPTHVYSKAGNYTVTLTVTDDGGKTNTDATYAVITGKPNHPPDTPRINGPINVDVNVEYSYTATSTDLDNDTIKYFFNWGDSTNNTTNFLPNGTAATVMHNWNKAGAYTIEVYAVDENNATSISTTLTVLVGIHYAGDIGYLKDTDGDGFYDLFHCNATGNETMVKHEDGNYMIDSDGDGKWDYTFNTTQGLSLYQEKEEQRGTPGFGTIMMLLSILTIMVLFRRRHK